jgi:hypothetical protein
MVLKDVRRWVTELQHAPQSTLSILHTGPVGLIYHQNISNLQDTGLNCLDVVAQPRSFDYQGGMRQAGNFNFSLPSSDSFDHDDLEASGI